MTDAVVGSFKNRVHQLVEVFYPQTFKTFYINSKDGSTLCQPTGVFVSLGITTSLKVINNIIGAINGSNNYKASLVEIGSKKEEGIFLNFLTSNTPKQYRIENIPGLMNREETLKMIESLKESAIGVSLEEMQTIGVQVTRLEGLLKKLDDSNGWNDHAIQKDEIGYRIYHLNINYVKKDETEYRIGILVNEKV